MLCVSLYGPYCIGWLDGPDDLDKCRKLAQVPGGNLLVGVALVIGLAALVVPRRLVSWLARGQALALLVLGIACLHAMWPIAALDLRIATVYLVALGLAATCAVNWRAR